MIDLVREAGVEVGNWIRSDNPAYCYKWSFAQPGKVVVLNLWAENMRQQNGVWTQRHNLRRLGEKETGVRKTRAREMDRDARYAYDNSLPVRVIVLDKKKPSDARAAKRELDATPWAVTSYNQKTGDWIVVRGAKPVRFVDQYSAGDATAGMPEKRPVSGSAYVRDREVRDQALIRAGGKCDYCGEQGFEMANGNIYLETHHIVPLSEGGKDVVGNVAALCANHHRQAHHGKDRVEMRQGLLERISGKP